MSEPIDISRTEVTLPPLHDNPVVWVAIRHEAIVMCNSTTVIASIVGVSQDRMRLEALKKRDHTISIELAEMLP